MDGGLFCGAMVLGGLVFSVAACGAGGGAFSGEGVDEGLSGDKLADGEGVSGGEAAGGEGDGEEITAEMLFPGDFLAGEEADIRPERSVVEVRAGGVVGSAVLWEVSDDGDGIVLLTAGHVVDELRGEELPAVVFPDGEEYICERYERPEGIDVALLFLLEAELAKKLTQEDCFVRVDRERFDSLRDGDGCMAVGSGDSEGAAVCTGEILDNWIYMEDYGQYMIWADVEIRPGMSGGGLFDGEGFFLGILSGGSEDGQLAAVPLSLILAD